MNLLIIYCGLVDCYQHSSENYLRFDQTTRFYVPEDSNFHTHLCENLKCQEVIMLSMSVKGLLIALMDRLKV
jgi:hypothetical protein